MSGAGKLYESERGDLRVVAVGDTMLTRKLKPFVEPDFLALVDLVRAADVSFTNLETTVRSPDEGAPSASVGTVMATPPELLEELKWMGFNLVGTANNHALDYGADGVRATVAHLRRADLAFAGSGDTLGKARAPTYLDTKMGRVALVAATAHVPPQGRAGDPRPDSPGRPGVNPLGFTKSYRVDLPALIALRGIKEKLRLDRAQARLRAHFFSDAEVPPDEGEDLSFLGNIFTRGDRFETITTIDAADAEANLRQIHEARRRADWVLFSFHNGELGDAGSETAQTRADMEEPAGFAVEFARAAIDAGADMVAGHGPHIPLGIEIYKGRPIYHSLGNFILQNDTVDSYPDDAYRRFGLGPDATPADFLDKRSRNDTRGFASTEGYWRSILVDCEFRDRKLAALRLHPVALGYGKKRSERGRPLLARGDEARRTLERVQHLSARYGTSMRLDGDVAMINLP